MKLRQVALPPVEFALLMRRRFIVEFSIVTGDTKLLDETECRQQLRMIEDDFDEDLLIKEVETPRAKPDQVDQEDRDRDYDECDKRAKPFQNASYLQFTSV